MDSTTFYEVLELAEAAEYTYLFMLEFFVVIFCDASVMANERILVLSEVARVPATRRSVSFFLTSRPQTCCWTEFVKSCICALATLALIDPSETTTVTQASQPSICVQSREVVMDTEFILRL